MDGVVLQVLDRDHAGRDNQMIYGEQETKQSQSLVHGGRTEFPGSGGFFMLFQHGLLFCGLFCRQFRLE